MKILVLADCESKFLWDYFEKEKLANIDLIISCGDLAPQYLSFLATFSHAPVLYVHGNHDDCYAQTPPEGCICIEDSVYQFKGLRILGLGGSVRYKDGEHQYTQ
ncbi:MAG: metallophosphoesterase, partial [Clostridium sp.]